MTCSTKPNPPHTLVAPTTMSTPSRILSDAEMEELTGYQVASKQLESLRRMGLTPVIRADGRPRITDDALVNAATLSDRTSFSALLLAPAIEPVRGLIQHTWADIVHYVSEKGKARIRNVVWGRMLELIDPHEPTDLTVIGHSAGSLIAVDLLFWLFSHQRDDPAELRAMGLDPDEVEAAHTNWRVRRLVTFGSPIAALLIRSTAVTDILADDGTLDAADLGLATRCHDGRMPLWLNVWDRHDVLAYPVEPFYTGAEIHDLYPDHSDSLLGSHEAYWHADRVHRIVAEAWGRQPRPLT